jgi:hypothetical protein
MVPAIFIGRGQGTPKVLFALKEKPYRHGQLRRRVGSVSQRMLTRTLRNLESTGFNRQARDEIEGHCGRVFLDAPGKDAHRSTQRYVPLGKTIPQGRDCGRVSFASAPGAMSETWDLSLFFCGFERNTIEKREES